MSNGSKWEIPIVVGVTIVVAFLLLTIIHLAYSETRYTGREFSVSFPGEPTSKTGTIGSPYGDVVIEEAEYNADGIWLHMRHAALPDQMMIEQTYGDIAIRMLAPLEYASKRSVTHMKLESLPILGPVGCYFVHFEANDHRWFCGIFVLPGHAWSVSTMDYKDTHKEAITAFLGSIQIPRIDEPAHGKK